jgi:hypothetical protein
MNTGVGIKTDRCVLGNHSGDIKRGEKINFKRGENKCSSSHAHILG